MEHNTITTGDCPVDSWAGCYGASWRDLIVPAAFAHPAKMARGLLKRILAHAFEEGWVKPGGVVLDPMAGIFTTGVMGAYENLNVIGIELEPRFYLLAQANIALHAAKWKILGCPQPVIIQGDSRELCKLLANCELVISSPPYEGSMTTEETKDYAGGTNVTRNYQRSYGKAEGQLDNTQGDTFWGAAKIIVEQCHQILKPGGVAIWVVKRFVRAGKIVEFSQDWARLCESVGFEVVCWHKAMLVKETVDDGLFGHKIVKKTERKSFFRRLAEAKNSPRIDWEDVICMRSRRAAPR